MVKAYAGILACPVSCAKQQFRGAETAIILEDGACPQAKKPVIDINKYLRPISLTSVISKFAQDFVVALHFGPAALEVIDPNQYGRITASSTPHALTYMVHVPGCKPPTGLGLL